MMETFSDPLIKREKSGVLWYDFGSLIGDAVQAAVSTRRGGVSDGSFASLNLSYSVGDDPLRVRENRRRFAQAIGLDEARVTCAQQVHDNRIIYVGGGATGAGYERHETAIPGVDGMVTDRPGIGLWLMFADCVPVLAYDEVRSAVGIAHAGWRGTLAGIARVLVETMASHFGSCPSDLRLAIGPSIGPCCYTVGPEVEDAFCHAWGDAGHIFRTDDRGRRLDLWEANRWLLTQSGVPLERIAVAGRCTRCSSDEFFSHRGQQGRAGRIAAVIALRPGG